MSDSDLVLQTHTEGAIADFLNAGSYPTNRGGKWQHTTVKGNLKK